MEIAKVEPGALESSADLNEMASVLARRPENAYRPFVSNVYLHDLALDMARDLTSNEPGNAYVLRADGSLCAIGSWRPLTWDSEQFGFRAARLDVLESLGDYSEARSRKELLLEWILRDCCQSGIHHLTARVGAGDFSGIHALEGSGFEIIDGIQTFALPLADLRPASANGLSARLFEEQDLEQVLAIARSSYVFDRFHADPALTKAKADKLHEVWVRNSCSGAAADAVVVATDARQVLAYVTCRVEKRLQSLLRKSFGTIVLVATASEARGRGAARVATYGALQWFQQHGVDYVHVGTQLRNVPASRLYEQCGFRLVDVSLTLRRIF